MNNQNVNQIQADVNEVINGLSQQVAELTRDNAVLSSLVNQSQQRINELEQQLQDNIGSDTQAE